MKIGGVDPKTLPQEELLVLPRGEKEIVFRAVGIPDYEEFTTVCPAPTAPGRLTKHGFEPNTDDKDYKALETIHKEKYLAWMVIVSLEPSDIEWDIVERGNPSTWTRWEEDMKNAGLTQMECNRITQLVFQANCLDEEKLAQARENFLLGQQQVQSESSGQNTGPKSTPSGKPASE